jgi:hypothetical protein
MFKFQKKKSNSCPNAEEDTKNTHAGKILKLEDGSCNPCFPCEILGCAAILGSCYGFYSLASHCCCPRYDCCDDNYC